MKQLSCCGTDCSVCEYYKSLCGGCKECDGRVFHAPEGKACPIFECVIEQKGLKNCGQCKAVPCSIWKATRDPDFTEQEFKESINMRIKALREEKETDNGE